MAMPSSAQPERPQAALSLFDAASIIVGIIVGSAIFQIAPGVAADAGTWAIEMAGRSSSQPLLPETLERIALSAVFGVWIVGAVVALIGAMCYAELATAYQQVGGTYVYLSEAFGRATGFAFAWAEFWIVRPGNIGAVAYVMAAYAVQLLPLEWQRWPLASVTLASAAILVLAVINGIGIHAGRRTQNALTAAKVVGLAAIIVIGLTCRSPSTPPALGVALTGSLGLALIRIMFAYGGWADISFVAAEVRDPERNIFRALLLGTGLVALIYVLTNAAFISALGLTGVMKSEAVAAEVAGLWSPRYGSRAISLLVVISCLGSVNGMLFTGARVFYALGTHHPTFRWLGHWDERTGVPLRSLIFQVLITLGLVVACGSGEGFERLVVFTAPFYWGFIALVAIALIVLRKRGATAKATYRVPLFPVTPILFALSSGAMVYAAIAYALQNRSIEALWAAAVVVAGVAIGWFDLRARRMLAAGGGK
jgi:basic amino acid/polyamine antiporter, APA family